MFLSEVIAQGGGIHCKVEQVVLSVEEPTELRGGKNSENAARSERDTARLECSNSDKEVVPRSTDWSCELRPQKWQEKTLKDREG